MLKYWLTIIVIIITSVSMRKRERERVRERVNGGTCPHADRRWNNNWGIAGAAYGIRERDSLRGYKAARSFRPPSRRARLAAAATCSPRRDHLSPRPSSGHAFRVTRPLTSRDHSAARPQLSAVTENETICTQSRAPTSRPCFSHTQLPPRLHLHHFN